MPHLLLREERRQRIEHHEVQRRNVDAAARPEVAVSEDARHLGLGRVEIEQLVDLAGLQRRHAIGRLRNDLEDDRFEKRLVVVPVPVVAHEPDAGAALPLGELERARAHRHLVGGVRRDVAALVEMARQDGGVEHRHLREKRRIGLLQAQHHGEGVRRVDLDAEILENGRRPRVQLADDLEQAELDVRTREVLAVVPLHALAQREVVGLAIGRNGPRGRQRRPRVVLRVEPHQPFEDLCRDVAGREISGRAEVQGRRIGIDAEHGRALAGGSMGVARAGEAADEREAAQADLASGERCGNECGHLGFVWKRMRQYAASKFDADAS